MNPSSTRTLGMPGANDPEIYLGVVKASLQFRDESALVEGWHEGQAP